MILKEDYFEGNLGNISLGKLFFIKIKSLDNFRTDVVLKFFKFRSKFNKHFKCRYLNI